jgi:translation initiation factor IF-2
MDIILLVADLSELKGDTQKLAEGIVLEANLDKQKGITAVLVIKDGLITPGMFVVSGQSIAPTRIIENFLGKKIDEATFSSPIRIVGFNSLPNSGDYFKTFKNKKEAEGYISEEKLKNQDTAPKVQEDMSEIDNDTLIRVMIKADISGALPAIEHEIDKIESEVVKIKIIGSSIGSITENDVKLAGGINPAIILGFGVKVDASAKNLAERSGVEIQTFNIIYKISEWLQEEVTKKTPKIIVEETISEIKVLKVFSSMKDKHVLGARVEKGTVSLGQEAKIIRDTEDIGRGRIRDLQKEKAKTTEVREGVEFGCQFQSEIIPLPGDKLEVFQTVEK